MNIGVPARNGVGLHISQKLGDIVKLPLFKREDPTKVREIWLSKEKPRIIHGVMAHDEYDTFKRGIKNFPNFILPVPRPIEDNSPGYYNVFMQYQQNAQGTSMLFVPLEDFKASNDAAPHVVVNFFEDLLPTHKLTLLRADVLSCKISKIQGSELIRLTREFYIQPEKFRWVKMFNERPTEFDYNKFVDEFRLIHRT